MVCSRWPEPRKSKKNKTADHMSTESDKSPNGVCSFVLYFRGFCMFCSRWPEPQKLKTKQNCRPHVHRVRQEPQWGLQFCCSFWIFEVFASPMGSAVLLFFVFRGFCMVCFAVYCCYHIKLPFTLRNPCRTLQNLAKSKLSHPPPSPPALLKNPTAPGIPGSNHNEPQQPPPKTVAAPQPGSTRAMETGRLYGDRDAYKAMSFDRENPVCDGLSGLWQGAARVQIPFEEVRRGSEPRPLGALGQFHAKKERR